MKTETAFNQAEFALLLERARGTRSINQYANDTGVSAAHISRFLRQMIASPPSPETISKLASKAYNEISYRDLMAAAGHIAEQNIEVINNGESIRESFDRYSPTEMKHRRLEIESKFFQIILTHLYTVSFEWNIQKPETRSWQPTMIIDIRDNEYTKWLIEFKATLDDRKSFNMYPYPLLGQIASIPLSPSDKITIAMNNESDFNRLLSRPPYSIRANLYIMLIDLTQGKIIREEKLCDYYNGVQIENK